MEAAVNLLKQIIREEISRSRERLQENTLMSTEEFRRPNGGLGTQGFTGENLLRLINHISNVQGFDLPEHSSLRELIDGLKASPEIKKMIFDWIAQNPIQVLALPEDEYHIKDGNHRANLLDLIGIKQLPVNLKRY